MLKRTGANDLDVGADDDFFQACVAGEGAFADHGDIFGNNKFAVFIRLSYAGYEDIAVDHIFFLDRDILVVGGRGVFGWGVIASSEASECHAYA